MKANLEFDLNDFDDKLSHFRCVKALDMACALWEFQMNSRKALLSKVTDQENLTPEDAVNIVFNHFNDLLNEHDINPDTLIV